MQQRAAQIWVDADACPVPIKEILFRAAERQQVQCTLVANQSMRTPATKFVNLLVVSHGFDEADNEIVRRAGEGDLVVTSDIPLAADALAKGAQVVSARGDEFSRENIRSRLNMRDFMDTMRASGVHTGGPPPLSQSEKQAFANYLDRWLTRRRIS
ncbi:YaiI/YqxD family protein [Aestuariibacter salexigens]|uniref:YaiI/YqxD family protein n=1 Tax=Aestuariibacter salexigens TaxID=226010 RepID=UPI0004039573|nr:YaiI/YqxD family protein [Aestuariibacter salexigens]